MLVHRWRWIVGVALALCLSGGPPAVAQEGYTLQGTVVDAATRRPLPNVQVVLGNSQQGTLTDAAGRYTLRARVQPGTYTLRFTIAGRGQAVQSVTLGAERTVDVPQVALQETAVQLAELVVTGAGVATQRRALGNAVSTVSAEEVAESPATTIDAALQGKVAGAQINVTSGTPGAGASVRLRGTSSLIGGAEPLYIVDGVIIDNSSDQIINFGYRSNPSNRLADLNPNDIERVEVLKGAAAAALYGSRANNGVIQIFTRRGKQGRSRVTAETRLIRGELARELPFALTPRDDQGNPVTRYDHQDLIFQDSWSNEAFASISGGSEQTQYYLSGSYTNQEGTMKGSDHRNINVRLNLDQSVTDWLRISGGANYINSNTSLVTNGEQGFGGLLTGIVFTPTTVDFTAKDPATERYVNPSAIGANPLEIIDTWRAPQTVSRFVGSFQTRLTPRDNTSLEYRFGYDTYAQETSLFVPRGSVAAGSPLGGTTTVVRDQYLLNNDLVGSASFEMGDAVELTTTAGMNHTYSQVGNVLVSASDLLPVTELARGAVTSGNQNQFETATLGFFAQQQVGWRDRLFLTGALRWDASSTFGADERWQLFPKISGSYVISDESFWADGAPGRLFQNFVLRAALGYAGNQPGGAYSRFSLFNLATNINRLGLVHSSSRGNPSLKPERQREIEVGFDASLLDERLGIVFTYYDQYVTDLLLSRQLTPSSGYSSMLANVGELSNKGVELQVNSILFNRPAFGWDATLTYSHNRNRVEKLAGSPFLAESGYFNRVVEGKPLGVFWMPDFQRDEQGQIRLDAQGLPLITTDRQYVGDPNPDFSLALTNEFRVGERLNARLLFDGNFGQEVWNQTVRIMDRFRAGPLYDRQLRGEVTDAYRIRYFSAVAAYLEDGSYVKLREASLRYNVAPRWARALGASSLDVEVAGRNLYTWTDYSGYDPEVNLFGASTAARGNDFAVYPIPRTVSFGVRVTY